MRRAARPPRGSRRVRRPGNRPDALSPLLSPLLSGPLSRPLSGRPGPFAGGRPGGAVAVRPGVRRAGPDGRVPRGRAGTTLGVRLSRSNGSDVIVVSLSTPGTGR
ncbi:hypothetical protein GCM10018781_41460 [Kitasatospora indigofera]|uniref:Uncharacterized protein n=1 Tax=Kitasatospora indigofera TaxID=67307 RepID=A0A919FXZ1_9ACTN|nr:hypothetical protein GCM10018781_41460 [Kitasatospora indigofera]